VIVLREAGDCSGTVVPALGGSVFYSVTEGEVRGVLADAALVDEASFRALASALLPAAAEVRSLSEAVVPFADLPLSGEGTPWSWTAEDQDAVLGSPPDWARYRKAHAWYDPKNAESKAGYKLPVAKMIAGRLTAVSAGVSAAMGSLNGSRGGVSLPAADRPRVYGVLVRYYRKAGRTAPPLKAS
jgi:hypothetical protein